MPVSSDTSRGIGKIYGANGMKVVCAVRNQEQGIAVMLERFWQEVKMCLNGNILKFWIKSCDVMKLINMYENLIKRK